MMENLLGTDGFGNDLLLQNWGAFVLTVTRALGSWVFVIVPAVTVSLWLGTSRSTAARLIRTITEALGNVPPLFILLLAAFYGLTGLAEMTVVIWIVLVPEAIRRITGAVGEADRQPFVITAREMQIPERSVVRWLILPAIESHIWSLALAVAFRIVVFDVVLGFLGYGRVAALASFGELFRNNRYLFLFSQPGTNHILPTLVLGVAFTIVTIYLLVILVSRFAHQIITGNCVNGGNP